MSGTGCECVRDALVREGREEEIRDWIGSTIRQRMDGHEFHILGSDKDCYSNDVVYLAKETGLFYIMDLFMMKEK